MYQIPHSSKQAASEHPDLKEFVGNTQIVDDLKSLLKRPPGSEANIMFQAPPGLGKTDLAIAFLRERFQNRRFMNGDIEDYRRTPGSRAKDVDDIREYQTAIPGVMLGFMMIHGATEKRSAIEGKLDTIVHNMTDLAHWYVLLDEAGELYFNGQEEMFRPILTDPKITVIATAQNFHSKRRTDSNRETDERLQAFLRRFSYRLNLAPLTDAEMIELLVNRMKKWAIKLDEPTTLRLLAYKSQGNPSVALRSLHKAIDHPQRILTREQVEQDDLDLLAG